MLIRIWACLMLICIAARAEKYDTVEAIGTAEKKESSRKVRHLQLKLQAARDLEKIESDTLTRDKKIFEYHDWLSEAQRQSIREMELEGKSKFEIRNKILEFFAELPATEKEKWNEYYKKQCTDWVEMVANKMELEKLKALKNRKTLHEYKTKLNEYKNRLPKEKQFQVDLWQNKCDELHDLNVNERTDRQDPAPLLANEQVPIPEDMKADEVSDNDIGRKKDNQLTFDALIDEYFNRLSKERQGNLQPFKERCREMWKEAMVLNSPKRSVDENGYEWLSWNIDDQMSELKKMCGSSTFNEIYKLAHELFIQLSEEKCRKYFLAMANEDEITRMNAAYNKMDYVQYKKIIDEIFHRQPIVSNKADQFYKICNDVYHKQIDRSKRDVDALIEKHLNWLAPDQKAEIKQMKANGEPLSAIKHKLLGYIKNLGIKERQYYTEKTRQSCYAWLDEVTTAEERAELEKLHQTNHSVCKRKIRDYIKRLSLEKQAAVNRDLEVCEHIWYEEHGHHNEEGPEHHHHHGHRKIRLVDPSERHDNYMKEDQQTRTQRHDKTEDGKRNENIENQMHWLSTEQIRQLEKFRKIHPTLAINQLVKFIETKDSKTQRLALRILARHCRQARYLPDDETAEDIEHVLKFTLGTQYGKILQKNDKNDDLDMEHNEGFNKRICGRVHRLLRANVRTKREHTHSHDTGQQQHHHHHYHHHHHHHHSLEHYFSNHLKWLSDAQKTEIKKMKEDGESRAKMQHKILEYYKSLPDGDRKEEAKEQLRGGCRELLSHIIGEEKTNELKIMKDSKSVDEINEKIEEWVAQIDDKEKKEQFLIYAPTCREVYGVKVGARYRRHHHYHTLEGYFETYLNWLTSKQKEELSKMKEEGKTKTDMQEKIFHYYNELHDGEKHHAMEQLEKVCREFVKDIAGEESAAELKKMRDLGETKNKIKAKVEEIMDRITDKGKREKINAYGPLCHKIYSEEKSSFTSAKRKDEQNDRHEMESYLKIPLNWLSQQQMDRLLTMEGDGASKISLQMEVMSYYERLKNDEKKGVTIQLQPVCHKLLKQIIGEQKTDELKAMREMGAPFEKLKAKRDEMLANVEISGKKWRIHEYEVVCDKIFENSFKQMKNSLKKRVDADREHYEGCNELLQQIVGRKNTAILKQMADEEANLGQFQAKIDEMMELVTDITKKQDIDEWKSTCREFYMTVPTRQKRDHHHKLEDYFQSQLKWLTDNQKAEIRKMKEEGKSKTIMQQKIMEYYDALGKEVRKEAGSQLQGGCRELLKEIIGEDKLGEMKEMKDSGAKWDEIITKLDKLLSEVTDKAKKEKIEEYGPICRKIYEDVRMEREQEISQQSLEHYMEKYFKWLNDEQKDEIQKMKKEGKSTTEKLQKVFSYFEKLEGAEKEKADNVLKSGCENLYIHILGEEKMNELKKIFNNGDAMLEEVCDKSDEMLLDIKEPSKLNEIMHYRSFCRKLYGLKDKPLEKHEEHGNHTLENYFEENLKWLSAEQKDELRKMKEDGKTRAELSAKVFHYYGELSGEAKQHATEILYGSCQQLLKKVIGEEHYEELKKLKNSGASMDELKAKADAMLSEITDEKKKEMIESYGKGCRELLTQVHQAHSLEEYFERYLKWLTDEQKKEVQKMKDEGKPKADIINKVIHFYESLSGEAKETASGLLCSACRGFIKYVAGEEKMAELNKLKDSGVSWEEMNSRIKGVLEEVKDEDKKKLIKEYGQTCLKFLMDRYSQQIQHTLDHYFKTYLKWLSEKQKEEVREMKQKNKTIAEIQGKVFGYLDHLEGDAKCHAVDLMYQGCREFLHQTLGDDKYEEVKKMKESGATYEELMKKVETLLEEVKDEKAKERVSRYMPGCEKVFAMVKEHKKHTHHELHSLEHYLETYLKWLSEEQKMEVKKMMDEKKSKAEIRDKIMSYYEELKSDEKDRVSDIMKDACQQLFKNTVGEAKFAEFEQFKDSTSEVKALMKKAAEMIEEVKDEKKKKLFQDYKPLCFKIDEDWYRKHYDGLTRRTPEDYFKKDLSWLSDEQKDELRQMKKDGKLLSEREDKVIEFLEKLDHEKKANAIALIQGGCRVVLKKVLGEESMAELKKMRDSGVSLEVLKEKIETLLEVITDKRKKEKAKEFGKPCRKVFTISFEFEEHGTENRTLEQYMEHELKWLTEEEKKELRNMKNENKTKKELLDKILQFYQKAEGSMKEEATGLLKKGCNDFILNLLGEEKAKDLKGMMDSGKPFEEINEKFNEYKEKITDEHKKTHLELYGPGCKQVYKDAIEQKKKQTAFARFKRRISMQVVTDDVASKHLKRSIDHHFLENYFATHLKWLSAKQQEELRHMKAAGKDRAEIQSKIFEFFTHASGETKIEATRSLQEGCHQLFKDIVGEQKAQELDVMVQSDVASEKLEKKIDELIESMGNESERTQAKINAETCKYLYGIRAA